MRPDAEGAAALKAVDEGGQGGAQHGVATAAHFHGRGQLELHADVVEKSLGCDLKTFAAVVAGADRKFQPERTARDVEFADARHQGRLAFADQRDQA